MGNAETKTNLRKSLSLPDTQQIFVNESNTLERSKARRSHRLFKFGSSRDVKKAVENTNNNTNSNNHDTDNPPAIQRPVPLLEVLFLPEFPLSTDPYYKVTEILAKGAYGNVVRIEKDDEEKQTFAMKVLSKNQIIVEGAVQQIKDEATIQSMLGDHPFIVKTYEYWQSRSLLYIVLEFISHGDMFTLWHHHGVIPEKLVRYFVAEIAVVLDFLHKSGVIFRDLKMENILFDCNGHIQLTDFGLAKWVQIGEKTRTICGTLQYMAPEVLAVYPYGHSADWWSLGILTYTLLIGQYPVDGAENHVEMATKVFQHEYKPPETVSSNAYDLLTKLLAKSPHRRVADLFSLQTLPFFKFTNFTELIERKVCPKDVVDVDFFTVAFTQNDQDMNATSNDHSSMNHDVEFKDFEWNLPQDISPVYI